MEEDINYHGEYYWHRMHQITGVFVCPQHKELLYDSAVLMRGTNRQAYIPATKENCLIEEVKSFSEDTFKKLLWIAEDVQAIFNRKFAFQSIKKHKYIYMERLIDRGYANLNTMVHQKKLQQDLKKFWGEEVLQLLQSPIDDNKSCLWLNSLVRDNHITSQPIRHLLVARFLGIDMKELLNNSLYKNIEKSHREKWEEKLMELSTKKMSIREIAIALDSTPKTIRKNIDKLRIEPFWKYNGGGRYVHMAYEVTEEFKERKKSARRKWLDLMAKNPELSRNNLRKLDEGLYTWLIRHDNKWLNANVPTIRNHYESVDWELKDEELLLQIKDVIREMNIGKPKRVRWSTVGGKLGINGWLSKRKDKLPQVKAYLDSREETLQDFHIRKIKWAIEELEKEGLTITKWKVLEKAGVNARYIPAIKGRINKVLTEKGYDGDLLN